MDSTPRASATTGARRVTIVTVAGVVALIAAAALFSSSTTAARVARNAEDLHWANAVLGSTDIARLGATQAVLVSEIDASSDAFAAALAEAKRTREVAAEWAASPASTGTAESELVTFLALAADVTAALDDGDRLGARLSLLALNEAALPLKVALEAAQEHAIQSIRETEETSGRVSTILQLFIVLALPLAAFSIYRRRVRTELLEATIRHDAEVQAARILADDRGHLIAAVSHQFRTPLTVIRGFSQVLSGDPSLGREHVEMVGLIDEEAHNLHRMVDDLLEAAKIKANVERVEFKPTDLSSLIGLVVSEVSPAATVQTPDCEVWAKTDPDKVAHILRNLLTNARQHGGPQVEATLTVKDGSTIIEIADNGPGVPKELEDRLFEPFVNEGGRALLTGSVGLGLSVARSLAVRIGGNLDYRSRNGTRFILTIPGAEERARNVPVIGIGP